MNKELGHRLWGASIVLWIVTCFGEYPLWGRVTSSLLAGYFFWYGVSRFEKGYKKIIEGENKNG